MLRCTTTLIAGRSNSKVFHDGEKSGQLEIELLIRIDCLEEPQRGCPRAAPENLDTLECNNKDLRFNRPKKNSTDSEKSVNRLALAAGPTLYSRQPRVPVPVTDQTENHINIMAWPTSFL